MAADPTAPTRRLSPADLPSDLRAKYEAIRSRAEVDEQLGLDGPPLDPDPTADAPFYRELMAGVGRLKAAREAAGLTLAEVSAKTNIGVETLTRLEAGQATNPNWQLLGRYAQVVGLHLTLDAVPSTPA
jgi:DNA-binding XRE family transcriptional regulator